IRRGIQVGKKQRHGQAGEDLRREQWRRKPFVREYTHPAHWSIFRQHDGRILPCSSQGWDLCPAEFHEKARYKSNTPLILKAPGKRNDVAFPCACHLKRHVIATEKQ